MKAVIIAVAVTAAAGVGGGFWYGHTRYKEGIAFQKAEYAAAAEAAQKKATAAERAAQDKVTEKEKEYAKDKAVSDAAATDMRSELERLQQQLAAARRNNSTTAGPAGGSDGTAASESGELLGECAAEVSGLAATADGYRDTIARWQRYGEVIETFRQEQK